MIIVNEGRIEQTGAPIDLYRHPAKLFVANFLGDSNVFAAGREERSGKIRLPFASANGSEPGHATNCWAMIRPEALELVTNENADFAAIVEASTFLGNRLRLRLRAGNEIVLLTRQIAPRRAERTCVCARAARGGLNLAAVTKVACATLLKT